MIIQAPAQAGESNQQPGQQAGRALTSCEDQRSQQNTARGHPAAGCEVIFENQMSQHRRGDHLQIEPHGNRSRRSQPQPGKQRQRTDDAAKNNRPQQTQPVLRVHAPRRFKFALPDDQQGDTNRSPQIKQPGQLITREMGEQRFADGGGGAKEQSRK